MGATIIKIQADKIQNSKKPLSPLQKKLLEFPVMTEDEAKEYKKINKWMRKWKV